MVFAFQSFQWPVTCDPRRRLERIFGWQLLFLLWVVQHLMKGLSHSSMVAAKPATFKGAMSLFWNQSSLFAFARVQLKLKLWFVSTKEILPNANENVKGIRLTKSSLQILQRSECRDFGGR